MTLFGLEEHIFDKIISVLSAHPLVEQAVIYGSRALGTFQAHSDIDLAIYASTIPDVEFARLRFEILELPIVFKIDIVHFDKLSNNQLKQKIIQEGKSIYPISKTNKK